MPSPRLRVKARSTTDWPLSIDDEITSGVDLTVFTSPLARIMARQAGRMTDQTAARRLELARVIEDDRRRRESIA